MHIRWRTAFLYGKLYSAKSWLLISKIHKRFDIVSQFLLVPLHEASRAYSNPWLLFFLFCFESYIRREFVDSLYDVYRRTWTYSESRQRPYWEFQKQCRRPGPLLWKRHCSYHVAYRPQTDPGSGSHVWNFTNGQEECFECCYCGYDEGLGPPPGLQIQLDHVVLFYHICARAGAHDSPLPQSWSQPVSSKRLPCMGSTDYWLWVRQFLGHHGSAPTHSWSSRGGVLPWLCLLAVDVVYEMYMESAYSGGRDANVLPDELAKRYSFFYLIGVIASAFSGIIAFGLMHMEGIQGIRGWRWWVNDFDETRRYPN